MCVQVNPAACKGFLRSHFTAVHLKQGTNIQDAAWINENMQSNGAKASPALHLSPGGEQSDNDRQSGG